MKHSRSTEALKRILAIVLLTATLMGALSTKSYAHNAYFLQVLIDTNRMEYQANVINDKANLFNLESKHIEATLGDFGKIANIGQSTGNYKSSDSVTDGTSAMIFTFPSHEVGGVGTGVAKNNATQRDANKAYEIRDTIVPSLNDAIKLITKDKPIKDAEELVKITEAIARGGSYNGYSVSYSGDVARVTKGSDVYEFTYRVKKGYSDPDDILYSPGIKGDADYLSWQHIIFQGNYSYTVKELTGLNSGDYNKPGVLEQKVVELLESALNGLRGILGLYDNNDLIYNKGVRGSKAWLMGTMPDSWAKKSLVFHTIFQAIGWSMIAIAVAKALLMRNIATVNPMARVNLIDSIKDLFVTGFLLANIYQIINLSMLINLKLVDIFATTAPDFNNLSGVNNYSNGIAGVIMQFVYFFISIYLNFTYIMRAIALAFLIATAPLFAVSIAFGGKYKGLFENWLKEFIGNVFLQSFHAFIFAFFMGIQTSSRGIEGVVVAFAIIPMTEFFRTLVLGQGGGMASSLGLNTMVAGANAIKGTSEMAGALAGGGKGDSEGGGSSKGSSSGSSGEASTDAGGGDIKVNNSSDIPGVSANPSRAEHSVGAPSVNSTVKAFNNRAVNEAEGTDVANVMGNQFKPKSDMQKNVEKTAHGMGVVSKGLGGATKVAMGAGLGVAMGGVNPRLGQLGTDLAKDGVGNVAGAVNDSGIPQKVGAKVGEIKERIGEAINGESSNIVGAEELSNGDMAVHFDKDKLNQTGLSHANMDSGGNAVLTYDTNKLSEGDQANINEIKTQFNNGNMEYLRSNGIENVSTTNDGKTKIHYNKAGQDKLQFSDIYTTNDRIVQTKGNNHAVNGGITYGLSNKSVSSQSNGNGGGGNPPDRPKTVGEEYKGGNSTKQSLDDRL